MDACIHSNEVGILLAYNGETCDLKWFWKLINIPNSPMSMPSKCKFFLNPLKVLNHYKSCPLHPSKTKLESSNLKLVYKYITGTDLIGAHNIIIDCKAQTAIIENGMIYSFVDKTKYIFLIDYLFSKHEQRKMKTRLKPAKPVHEQWIELNNNDDPSMWELIWNDTYSRPEGGPKCGPSSAMQNAVCTSNDSLVPLFLLIFPISLLNHIVIETNRYAYMHWVYPKNRLDHDGNTINSMYLAPIQQSKHSFKQPIPDATRHCANKEQKKYPITLYFVLAWLGILIIMGGTFVDKQNQDTVWNKMPYGIFTLHPKYNAKRCVQMDEVLLSLHRQ